MLEFSWSPTVKPVYHYVCLYGKIHKRSGTEGGTGSRTKEDKVTGWVRKVQELPIPLKEMKGYGCYFLKRMEIFNEGIPILSLISISIYNYKSRKSCQGSCVIYYIL